MANLKNFLPPMTLAEREWFDKCPKAGRGTLLSDAKAEIERLRSAAELAASIIDRNLYHQREKVEDAATILKQALGN